ncbi:DUF4097 family beta strand repeat-containing protein [Chryseobacterium piscium]|jgi:hypothetical protein|nr:DUF4097 family beta strand repeat-containing protein [Chryseobacterium piscium]
MKKIYLILFALMTLSVHAQEDAEQANSTQESSKTYKIKKSKGKLLLNLGKVMVEGYKGSEIIFSVKGEDDDEDKRAEGLQIVNSLGLVDNTGLGINVNEKDGILEVNSLKKMSFPDVKILVPENVIISFKHQSQYGGDIVFKNIQNEIEIATTYNNIKLENITGPATVKSIYGKVEAVFSQNTKGPLSIISVYGLADVTLPKSVKANLKTTTSYGEIYMSPDFKIDVEKKDGLVRHGDELIGKVNGGGTNIEVRSDYSKVYLRAK